MNPLSCVTPWGLLLSLLGAYDVNSVCYEIHHSPVEPGEWSWAFYLPFFGMTLLLESPIYFFGLSALSKLKRIQAILLVNLATHPIIFYAFPEVLSRMSATYGTYLLAAEIFAPVVEALILWKGFRLPPLRAFTISIATNLISWWIGVLLL